jgi:hypothetical protein
LLPEKRVVLLLHRLVKVGMVVGMAVGMAVVVSLRLRPLLDRDRVEEGRLMVVLIVSRLIIIHLLLLMEGVVEVMEDIILHNRIVMFRMDMIILILIFRLGL